MVLLSFLQFLGFVSSYSKCWSEPSAYTIRSDLLRDMISRQNYSEKWWPECKYYRLRHYWCFWAKLDNAEIQNKYWIYSDTPAPAKPHSKIYKWELWGRQFRSNKQVPGYNLLSLHEDFPSWSKIQLNMTKYGSWLVLQLYSFHSSPPAPRFLLGNQKKTTRIKTK